MFDKLKRAFSDVAKSITQKEISDKDLNETLFDLNISLLESDLSQEVVDDLSNDVKKNLLGMKLQKDQNAEQIIKDTIKSKFSEILSKTGSIDLLSLIQEKKHNKGGPFVIVFLGINGTGKTTTVAKIAHMLRKMGLSIVIAAADTHRAGAIEQISAHAEKLSIKIISQRYGADPSAVARDGLEYAKKHYVDVVLVDTAGRMQTAKNLMDEIGKIVKVIKPDIKLFVGDSLAGNDTINQAREFFSYTQFDGAILTKSDADAKGGSVISISYITSKPILYLGVGQSYDDLIPFNQTTFLETIFNNGSLMDSHSSSQINTLDNKTQLVLTDVNDTLKTSSLDNELNSELPDNRESSSYLQTNTVPTDDDKNKSENLTSDNKKKNRFGWFKKKE